eukprot:gnl/MRDRNA2_/MRDRNA2_183699_c0_seq1.p2 gnl/MRDRNA2_/MRDRNA2_183699_c0~~gnl/MRDRNA2_/MRDRNA2_183699_c0_seq1.p2  ORF type:complete len:126 (-),score=16.09 gnl/MRDRNA2_/MRDRNA2_183699_c0_seq1:176-553(-)
MGTQFMRPRPCHKSNPPKRSIWFDCHIAFHIMLHLKLILVRKFLDSYWFLYPRRPCFNSLMGPRKATDDSVCRALSFGMKSSAQAAQSVLVACDGISEIVCSFHFLLQKSSFGIQKVSHAHAALK